jgi:hypothetical protein
MRREDQCSFAAKKLPSHPHNRQIPLGRAPCIEKISSRSTASKSAASSDAERSTSEAISCRGNSCHSHVLVGRNDASELVCEERPNYFSPSSKSGSHHEQCNCNGSLAKFPYCPCNPGTSGCVSVSTNSSSERNATDKSHSDNLSHFSDVDFEPSAGHAQDDHSTSSQQSQSADEENDDLSSRRRQRGSSFSGHRTLYIVPIFRVYSIWRRQIV